MSGKGERGRTPWLELATGGIGALLLALMAGYLLLDAFRGGEAPADIVIEREGAFFEQSAGWRVPVIVRNLGDRPAEAVELRAELSVAGEEDETVPLTVDFLPPRGAVEAAFMFERDPRGGELRLRAVGYLQP